MKKWTIIIAICLFAAAAAGCGPSVAGGEAAGHENPSGGSSGSPAEDVIPSDHVLPESEWGDLFEVMGEDYVSFGQRVLSETPVRSYVMYQGAGGGEPVWFDDAETIIKMCNALAVINVTEETGEIRTDDYTSFGFEFEDGSRTSFMFDSLTIQVEEDGKWQFYGLQTNPVFDEYAGMAKEATLGQS